jgi:hypothetical protein
MMEVSPAIEMAGTSFTSPRKSGSSTTIRRSQREAVTVAAPVATVKGAVEKISLT